MQSTPSPNLDFHNIRLTPTHLIELEDNRPAISIPLPSIQRITPRHGFQSPHPFLQIAIGLILIAPTYYVIVHILNWLRFGGILFTAEIWFLPLALLGLYLALTALRRGHYLDIQTTQGRKRLALHKSPDPQSLDNFLHTLKSQHNLPIEKL